MRASAYMCKLLLSHEELTTCHRIASRVFDSIVVIVFLECFFFFLNILK
jgi:hypothetical protein